MCKGVQSEKPQECAIRWDYYIMQVDVIPLANEIASKRQSVQLNLVTDL